MDYIGIDLHKNASQVCILTEDGELVERRIKTDKRDARALCEACRLGAYRPAHRTSDRQRDVRAHLAVRETLVRTRSKYISLIGALARREGCRIPAGPSPSFARSLLMEAAWSLLRWKTERTRALHEWWARIARRRVKPTAVVALARKLAGIMFAVWRDGTEFDPQLLRPRGALATA